MTSLTSKQAEIALVIKVLHKMKEKPNSNCEIAFAELDSMKAGYLTTSRLQAGLPEVFDVHLTKDQLQVVVQYMDSDDDGTVTQKEFSYFYNDLESKLITLLNIKPETEVKEITLDDIFEFLLEVLKDRNLSLFEIFKELDEKRKGYLLLEEFVGLLHTIGFIIIERKPGYLLASDLAKEAKDELLKLESLFKAKDITFNGKISYKLMHKYASEAAKKFGIRQFEPEMGEGIFKWKDKTIESIIKTFNGLKKEYGTFFFDYDLDKDGVLSIREFREACKGLSSLGLNIGKNQIERLLLLFAGKKANTPCVSIAKINEFLIQYANSPFYSPRQEKIKEISVSEDLFVLILQQLDGFRVFMDNSYTLYEKSLFLRKHIKQIATRGCSIVSNQCLVTRLFRGANNLTLNLYDVQTWLSSFALEMIKKTSRAELLSTKEVIAIAEKSALKAFGADKIPEIDSKMIDIGKDSKYDLPSGCTCYKGTMGESKTPVRIQLYRSDLLIKTSKDGNEYWKHLEIEQEAQLYLHTQDPNLTFKILGKYQKQIGIGEHLVELYVVSEDIRSSEYISFEDFLNTNGGLLHMPLLKGTEAALYIAKMWSLDILHIIKKLHEGGFILRSLDTSQLFLHKPTGRIKFGHFRGIGKANNNGKLIVCPDISLHSKAKSGSLTKVYDNAYLPSEHILLPFKEHMNAMDIWSFGAILYSLLFGIPPQSYLGSYESWMKSRNAAVPENLPLPLIEPAIQSFVYDPFSDLNGTERKYENTFEALKQQSYSAIVGGKSWLTPFKEEKKEEKKVIKKKKRQKEVKKENLIPLVKSAYGLILDVIACCLDVLPQNRPTLTYLLGTPVFKMDNYERSSVSKFAESVFLYKSPYLCVTTKITQPLRNICLQAIKEPSKLLSDLEKPILFLAGAVSELIRTISTPHIKEIHKVMIDSSEGSSPHIPIAKQIVKDNIMDMFLFLAHRYTRLWLQLHRKEEQKKEEDAENSVRSSFKFKWKTPQKEREEREIKRSQSQEIEGLDDLPEKAEETIEEVEKIKKSYDLKKLQKARTMQEEEKKKSIVMKKIEKEELAMQKKVEENVEKNKKTSALRCKHENRVLRAVMDLIHKLVIEMQYQNSVMAPYVGKVIQYIVKLFIGEDYYLASDLAIMENESETFKFELTTFYRNIDSIEDFTLDSLDKAWVKRHKNMPIVSYDTYWNYATYTIVLPIYQEAIGTGGLGGGQYPVIHEYIKACNSDTEMHSKIGISNNMINDGLNVGEKRTSEYYTELLRICENLVILTDESFGRPSILQALSNICEMVYKGNRDRAKALLDLRITKYLHSFLQHPDEAIRKQSLLMLNQLSRAYAKEDSILMLNLQPIPISIKEKPVEEEKIAKLINLTIEPEKTNQTKKKTIDISKSTQKPRKALAERDKPSEKTNILPEMNKEQSMVSYVFDKTMKSDPTDTKRYISFARDLPTVHFHNNKIFLSALGRALESPAYSSILMRLLKAINESYENKYYIMQYILL